MVMADSDTRPDRRPDAGCERRGLTADEVAERYAAGLVNHVERRSSRTVGEIVRANVLTRFNAIISVLAAVVLVVGHPIDALFALVMVVNSTIGIVQEVRAKRTLDRLTLLVAPTIIVLRDGVEQRVAPTEIVVDDALRLMAGDEIPVDGRVLDGTLEVDESALTGEAEPVVRGGDDEVRSGSVVVAGAADVLATRVGHDAWIQGLVTEARRFEPARSELRSGVDRILRLVGWVIAPLALLSLWSQLRVNPDVGDGLVAAVAGVVGLVPQGLVLLVSMAMAVAIIRLARRNVIVQELHAVEGLARADVLCLDKTGTLTTGRFKFEDLIALDDDIAAARDGLAALVAAEASPTASSGVLAAALAPPAGWTAVDHVPFSSARKWSATTFASRGTWVLGAPEVILDAIGGPHDIDHRRQVADQTELGHRVLLVARSDRALATAHGNSTSLPVDLVAVALVVLAEEIRPDAADTLAYFARQHVDVRVISGDHPATVSAVARAVGVEGADRYADLRSIEATSFDELADETKVFGRVHPDQKRDLVGALQRAGHIVAMTGDGVNDIPALKRADLAIAMDTATPATKAISQVVLVDGRFDRLPGVVAEGRRVVANMERVATLFLTKTAYTIVLIVAVAISGTVYPLLPRHMSLVSELTIGIPAFLLSFRAASDPCRPGFLRRVLVFAAPAGLLVAAITFATYWIARSPIVGLDLDEARSVATVVLIATALWVLSLVMRPIDRYDAALLFALVLAIWAIASFEITRDFYALVWPSLEEGAALAALSVVAIATFELVLRRLHPGDWRWVRRLADGTVRSRAPNGP
jgi:cation-transporting ATPase E